MEIIQTGQLGRHALSHVVMVHNSGNGFVQTLHQDMEEMTVTI